MEGKFDFDKLNEQLLEAKFHKFYDQLIVKNLSMSELTVAVEGIIHCYNKINDENESEFVEWALDNLTFDDTEQIFENFLRYANSIILEGKKPYEKIGAYLIVLVASRSVKFSTENIRFLYNHFGNYFSTFEITFCLMPETPDDIFDRLLLICNGKNFENRWFDKVINFDFPETTPKVLQRARLLLVDIDIRIPEQIAQDEFTRKEILYILQDNHEESTVANPDLNIPYYTIAELATINLNNRK